MAGESRERVVQGNREGREERVRGERSERAMKREDEEQLSRGRG